LAETVSSKFDWGFVMKFIVYTLLVSGVLSTIVVIIFSGNYSPVESLILFLLISLLACFYIVFVIRQMIVVTAAPEGILIKSLITGKSTTIEYKNIEHVSSLNVVRRGRDGVDIIDHRKLKIELNTGKHYSFTNMQFNNYDELKEAIRRHRFHLD